MPGTPRAPPPDRLQCSQEGERSKKRVYYYCGPHVHQKANAAVLVGEAQQGLHGAAHQLRARSCRAWALLSRMGQPPGAATSGRWAEVKVSLPWAEDDAVAVQYCPALAHRLDVDHMCLKLLLRGTTKCSSQRASASTEQLMISEACCAAAAGPCGKIKLRASSTCMRAQPCTAMGRT